MRLSLASYAYFGLFLAKAMARLGHLERLYTNLPWTHLRDVPAPLWRSQPLLCAPQALNRWGFPKLAQAVGPLNAQLFSAWVERNLTECDLYHCFSGFGGNSFAVARERFGALTVVERGSTHIRYQNDILVEEHKRWGVPFEPISAWTIDREEADYAICDRITIQSTFAERTFIERGVPAEKLIKLPLGVDVSLFKPVPKEDTKFRVLSAGTCSVRKGTGYLLEAASQLRLRDWELLFNGSVAPEMKSVMAKHEGSYRFQGFQPRERLPYVYSQASVVVVPTIEDGFAQVITEAMACGVPVIATPNCCAPDVIEDGVDGFVVPIRDTEALKEKIVYLYENPEKRAAMGRAAMAKAQSAQSLDTYGDRAAAAYQKALADRRRSH